MQSKLFRWNLTPPQQVRYGIERDKSSSTNLFENIAQIDNVRILDAPGFGRIALLICADLSAEQPKTWIHINLLIDWSFVVLMDGTISENNWAYRCANKLSNDSGSRVVVGNSLWLIARNNDELRKKPSSEYKPLSEAGIGLFVDRRALKPIIREANVSTPPLTVYADWTPMGWT